MMPLAIFWTNDLYSLPKLTLIRIFTYTLILAWLIKIFSTGEIEVIKSRIYIPLFIFLFFITISTLFSVDHLRSLEGKYVRYEGFLTYLNYMVIFFLALNTFKNKEWIIRLIKDSIIAAFIISIYGIFQYFGYDFIETSQIGFLTRSFSTMGNSAILAGYLAFIGPLAINIFLQQEKVEKKLFWLLANITIFACLIFTYSRGGWVGFFIGILFLLIFERKKLWKYYRKQILIIFLALLIMVLIIGLYSLGQKISLAERVKATIQMKGSITSRIYNWNAALKIMTRESSLRFLIGTGLETFDFFFPKYVNPDFVKIEQGAVADKAHNDFLQVGSSTGLLGLCSYLFFLVVFFWMSINYKKQIKSNLFNVLIAAIIAYFVQVQFSFSVPQVTILAWLAMGLAIRTAEWELKDNKKIYTLPYKNFFSRNINLILILLSLIWLIVTILSLRLLIADTFFYRAGEALSKNDLRTTIKSTETATNYAPNRMEYYILLGSSYRQLGSGQKNEQDFQNSLNSFMKAQKITPLSFEVYQGLGRLYLSYDKIEEAQNMLKKSISLNGYNPNAHLDLAIVFDEKGDYDKALAECLRAIQIAPNSSTAYFNLGICYEKKGEPDSALNSYKKSLEIINKLPPSEQEARKDEIKKIEQSIKRLQ